MWLKLLPLLLLKEFVMNKIIRSVFSIMILMFAAIVTAEPRTIELPADLSKLRESELPGYTIALQKCGICHSADYINYQPPGQSLAQWTAEMKKMQHSYGAPISDDEVKIIGAYLAVAYGSAKIDDADVIAVSALSKPAAKPTSKTAAIDVDALLNNNACLGCHAIETKVVGPAFRDVAAKYKGNANAKAAVTQSIKAGGSGKWGAMAMPPMAGLSDAEAGALADYVLAL
jgi:cytochrome c551/c552